MFSSVNEHDASLELIFQKLDSSMQTKLDNIKYEILSSVDELKKMVDVKLKKAEERCEELEKVNLKLSADIIRLENQSRRNNLIFYNIQEEYRENWEKTEYIVGNFIVEVMKVGLSAYDIERAHRLGGRRRNRPIIVKFLSWKKKMEVLNSIRTLRGTPIRITEDYAESTRHAREELKPLMIEARNNGLKASLRVDRLIVNGKSYSKEEWIQKNSNCRINPVSNKMGRNNITTEDEEQFQTENQIHLSDENSPREQQSFTSTQNETAINRQSGALAKESGESQNQRETNSTVASPSGIQPRVAAEKSANLMQWLEQGTLTRSKLKKNQMSKDSNMQRKQ
jgi:hypothetical protein